jgi:hypothetical protein
MQIKMDASIGSMLEAKAVQVLQKNKDDVPNEEEKVLGAEAAICNERLQVDDQGFVTTKRTAVGKLRKKGSGKRNASKQ